MNALDNARPMGFRKIFVLTFQMFYKQFKVFTLLTFLLWGFFLVINRFINIRKSFEMNDFDLDIPLFTFEVTILHLLMFLGYTFVKPILDIAITNVVLKQFSNQQIGSVHKAIQSIEGKIGKAIGTNFIFHFFIFICIVTSISISFFLMLLYSGYFSMDTDLWFAHNKYTFAAFVSLTYLLTIPLLILCAYFFTRLSLYFPVIAAENIGYLQALVRSWELTRSASWRIFGLYFLLGIVVTMYYNAISFLVAPVFDPAYMNIPIVFLFSIILIIQSIAVYILYSLVPIVVTHIYIDLQVPREREDIRPKHNTQKH